MPSQLRIGTFASLTLPPSGSRGRLKRPLSRGSSASGYSAEPFLGGFFLHRRFAPSGTLPASDKAIRIRETSIGRILKADASLSQGRRRVHLLLHPGQAARALGQASARSRRIKIALPYVLYPPTPQPHAATTGGTQFPPVAEVIALPVSRRTPTATSKHTLIARAGEARGQGRSRTRPSIADLGELISTRR